MNFDAAVEIILKHEGGYVNNPKDPGGETSYGISQRAYPDLNIEALTRMDAIRIYKRDYWDACHCGELPENIRLLVFDCAVNQGVGFAIQALQKILGLGQDGIVGPKTIMVLNTLNRDIRTDYAVARMERYVDNNRFEHFGKGWLKRLMKTLSMALMTQRSGPTPVPVAVFQS